MGPARGRTARKVDVVLLDGANDAQRTLDEFLVARKILRSPGLIIVDDVDMSSQEVVKGHLLVPHLDSEGIPYRIVTREGDGFSTGVLVFRV
jgi:predicted O-methyltransferase YrrM